MDLGRDNGWRRSPLSCVFPCRTRSVTAFRMSIVPRSERSFNRYVLKSIQVSIPNDSTPHAERLSQGLILKPSLMRNKKEGIHGNARDHHNNPVDCQRQTQLAEQLPLEDLQVRLP